MPSHRDDSPCRCAELVGPRFDRFDRRRLFLLVAAGGLATVLPSTASAAYGSYEAMALTCIDPRFQAPVFNYLGKRGLTGKYSQFTIAGAAVGVVAPAFKDWHKAFWDNLAASVRLHRIKKAIVMNHRDCGAVRIAYGDAAVATEEVEDKTHRMVIAEFRKQLAQHQPGFGLEAGLMALDGSVLKL